MSIAPPHRDSAFDEYADHYGDALGRGLRLSGESSDYFALKRVQWLGRAITALGIEVSSVLDYGCGTGATTRLLKETLHAASATGVDVSSRLLDIARREHSLPGVSFLHTQELQPAGQFDVVYTNGVFHHIAPGERPSAVDYAARCLRPGGLLAFWENNPWNLGARWIMSRISFDRDAVMLSSRQARGLLRSAGLAELRVDYLFVFPRVLRLMRPLEPRLSGWPLGAQYMVLARKD